MAYRQSLENLRQQLFNFEEKTVEKKKTSGLIPVRLEKPDLKEAKLPVYADWLKGISSAAAEIRAQNSEITSENGFAKGFKQALESAPKKSDPALEAVPEENRESFIQRRGGKSSYYAPQPSDATSFKGLIDIHEGGGDYDTLFQHSQREGGAFENVKVSQMTIGELKEFSGARGAGSYYQWSKENMPAGLHAARTGQGSTPMGRYQFIGSTLKEVANEMGLSDDTVFDAKTQDAMFDFYLKKRISRGKTLDEKITQVRLAWEGFKNVDRNTLANLIVKYES